MKSIKSDLWTLKGFNKKAISMLTIIMIYNGGGKGHVEWKQFKQLGMVLKKKDVQLDKFEEKNQNKTHFIIGSKNYDNTLMNFAP